MKIMITLNEDTSSLEAHDTISKIENLEIDCIQSTELEEKWL